MLAPYGPVFLASFLASTVELVEAFAIVLVIGVTITTGAAPWPAPGSRWLPWRQSSGSWGLPLMRYAGLKAVHDEEAIYEQELADVRAHGGGRSTRIDPFGVVTSFKSVLLEGLEVAFIVITFGIQSGSGAASGIPASAAGAALALVAVVAVGNLIRAPLQKVPENTLKFVLGIMLVSFRSF